MSWFVDQPWKKKYILVFVKLICTELLKNKVCLSELCWHQYLIKESMSITNLWIFICKQDNLSKRLCTG